MGQDDNTLRAPDTSQSYHPARSTCMLSLPAHDRQEVVTDDRGSGYPRGNLFLQPGLLGGGTEVEEIIRHSREPSK